MEPWGPGLEGVQVPVPALDRTKGRKGGKHRATSGYTGSQARDHGEAAARRILETGLELAGLEKEGLAALRKNDWRKRAIGRTIRRHTTVPAAWIAEALHMGHPVRTAALTARNPDKQWGPAWRNARKLTKELSQRYESIDPFSRKAWSRDWIPKLKKDLASLRSPLTDDR